MGIRVEIANKLYEITDYSTSEDSTPLSVGDSSGGIGTIDFTIPNVDNPYLLKDKDVFLSDSNRGSTLGRVDSVNPVQGTNLTRVSCFSRLSLLNVYNVQAQPFRGTLEGAFRYYLGLANVSADVAIDASIKNKAVIFPGWYGELWFNFKNLAAAHGCEIALVSDVILLRPVRTHEAERGFEIDQSIDFGGTQTALGVEVYRYDSKWITNSIVYPPKSYTGDVSAFSIGAGEYAYFDVELSASVTSVKQPEYRVYIAENFMSDSVYTATGDDGAAINATWWKDYGGRLWVTINEDTTSLRVHVTAPTGIRQPSDMELVSTFTIGYPKEGTGNRYSTLRILGTGVEFDKVSNIFPTGLTPRETSTEVGVTIDNPFITDANTQFNAGARLAADFRGESFTLRGSTTRINKRGDRGIASYTDYDEVQASYGALSYNDVAISEGSTSGPVNLIPDPAFNDVTNTWAFRPGTRYSVTSVAGQVGLEVTGATSVAAAPTEWLLAGRDYQVGDTFQYSVTAQSRDPHTSYLEPRIQVRGSGSTGTDTGPAGPSQGIRGPAGTWTYDQSVTPVTTTYEAVVDSSFDRVAWALYGPWENDGTERTFVFTGPVLRNLSAELRNIDTTYDAVQAKWDAQHEDDFENQVHGNANGSRVWHAGTKRWYRIRSASLSRASLDYDADEDTIHSDAQKVFGDRTYNQMLTAAGGATYTDVYRKGLV